MKEKRFRSALSLLTNLSIVFFMIESIRNHFRADVIKVFDQMTGNSWEFFRYFTSLSNIFVTIAAIVMIVFSIRNIARNEFKTPMWAIQLKFISTLTVTLTMVTVVFFLAPTWAVKGDGYFALFRGSNLFMHFLTPLTAILTMIFLESTSDLPFKTVFVSMIPVGIYTFFYILFVVFIKIWPDFYGFTFGGKLWIAPISLVVMAAVTFGLAALLWKLQKVAGAKFRCGKQQEKQ